jgi:hypothetical protein
LTYNTIYEHRALALAEEEFEKRLAAKERAIGCVPVYIYIHVFIYCMLIPQSRWSDPDCPSPLKHSFLEAELQASKGQYERRREEAERAAAAERER